MSKRATTAAYGAYPLNESNRFNHEYNAKRVGFYQGYEQAEKDTTERMIDWLDKNWRNYIMGPDADGCIGFCHWKNDFRKAILEEE